MSNKEKIRQLINNSPGSLCDDCLTLRLGLPQRQQAYQRCKELSELGAIGRGHGMCTVCAKAKKVNWRLEPVQEQVAPLAPPRAEFRPLANERPWYWEGHVQEHIVSYLRRHGYTVSRTADTVSKEAGKDIVAVNPEGMELWVTVKGFPTPKGSTNVQARHWFAHAIFDLVLYRGENPNVDLALGLPDGFTTYQSLSKRVAWFQEALPFRVFWVDSSGQVRVS